MSERFRNLNLKTKIIILTIIISLVPVILLSVSSYRLLTSNLTGQKSENTLTNLRSINQSLNSIVNTRKITALRTIRNTQIVNYLSNPEENTTEESEYALERFFNEFQVTNGVQSVSFYSPQGVYRTSGTYPPKVSECRSVFTEVFEKGSDSSFWGKPEKGSGEWALPFYIPVADQSNKKIIGLLTITFYEDELESTYSYFETDSERLFMLDRNGTVMSAYDKDYVGKTITDYLNYANTEEKGFKIINQGGKQELFTCIRNEPNDFYIICLGSLDSISQVRENLANTVLLAVGASMAIVFLLALFLSNNLTRPVNKLVTAIKSMKIEDTGSQIGFHYHDEIGVIGNAIDDMSVKLHESSERLLKEQKAKREAELQSLMLQINPHFLYNTLSTAIWMIQLDKKKESIDVITALAELFKLGVNRGNEETSIENELKYVLNYLRIQSYRYRDEFSTTIVCPDELKECRMLKLLLQPLVENAIYHGRLQEGTPSKIEITVRETGKDVELIVSNSPESLESKKINALNAALAGGDPEKILGAGLKTVNERLRISYGKEYGIVFCSNNGSTCAVIRVPDSRKTDREMKNES